jgi:hypothetical protein
MYARDAVSTDFPNRYAPAAVLLALSAPLGLDAGIGVSLRAQAAIELLLDGARCETVLRRQLQQWDTRLDRAITDPPGPTALRSVRAPTGVLGFWTRVAEAARGELVIERVSSTRIERLSFDETCAPREIAVAPPPRPTDAYGDSDLIARVAQGDRGVFLLWSPHMPLSVDQHDVLAEVARELDLIVVPLLDPGADSEYAARIALERGLPGESLRPLGGVELVFRGLATHTPSLQVFAGGSLVGPVLPGYRSKAALRATLEAILADR